jgi:anti-sigma factor RsiW
MAKQKRVSPAPSVAETRLTCQQVTDLIVDYVTGELDPTIGTVFETHLRNCRDCAAFLNTYRETIRAARAVRYEDLPAEMLNRVQRFLQDRLKKA